jgi:CelD/BcsL family acetyltransferase involved in cellulose biosynthesis
MAIVRSIQQLESIADEWNGLADGTGHALLRHEWFLSAAHTLHDTDALTIVAVLNTAGRLAAVAPLVTRIERGMPRLELLGSAALHEPTGFLCPDPDSRVRLLESIFELRRPMLLQRVTIGSLPAVPSGQSTGRHGLVISRPGATCLGIEFGSDWEAPGFFDTLPGKLRYDIRRARARADAAGLVTFDVLAPTPPEVDLLFAEFMRVEASGWKGRQGSALAANPRLRAFFRFYCERTAEMGSLRLFRLRIQERVVAVQMAVEVYKRLWILKIAYDEAMAHCSPGLLLTADTIRHALDRGLDGYEFLGSVEPWEERWKPQRRDHRFVLFYPWTVAGCVGVSVDLVGAGWRHVRRAAHPNA